MSSQRYERVSAHDEDDHISSPYNNSQAIPNSPPPSFRSHTSSPVSRSSSQADSPTDRRRLLNNDPLTTDAERELADTFDASDASDDEYEHGDGVDDRQRLMRGQPAEDDERGSEEVRSRPIERRVTQLPVFTPQSSGVAGRRIFGGNDGVFANLSAKPTRGEEVEEKPPTYEQAAADATPPYWETTILAPGTFSDEVFVDGLAVGSVFSFTWNALISMSFQLVGFLLTYLLHTTHAAKNGSRAGLGITLIQYGFSMKGAPDSPLDDHTGMPGDQSYPGPSSGVPPDPNAHNFDPSKVAQNGATAAAGAAVVDGATSGISTSDWVAYILMLVGWFILIKSVSDFLRARRHEQLVLSSNERNLGVVPVVAEGENPERTV